MAILFKYLAKVAIEFTTPFHVGSGNNDDVTDSPVLLDHNGLPTIPGSSIAGVLRSEFRKSKTNKNNPALENALFGYQKNNKGEGSLLNVSWASIHNSHNKPQEGILSQDALKDSILVNAQNRIIRDHVRITHRGASDSCDTDGRSGHGKFDEAIVCAGNRFSFELELSTSSKEEGDLMWKELLAILHKPVLRFGGRSRRGLGAFKIVSCKEATFDLSKQLKEYLKAQGSLDNFSSLKDYTPITQNLENYEEISLEIEPESYWMFGGGVDNPQNEKEADMAPVKGKIITWKNNEGKIQENNLIIPGSSIKGAISHRVAYYYNLLNKNWAEITEIPQSITGEYNLAVQELFGYCKEETTDGGRGKVIINDIFVANNDYKQKLINHVSIDRFTGGAMPGKLFSERPVYSKTKLPLKIYVEKTALKEPNVKEAFKRALLDLAEGRLQLGAGSGRGNGFFKATAIPEFLK